MDNVTKRQGKEGVEWKRAFSYGRRAVLGYLCRGLRVPSYATADGADLPT